MTRRLNRVLFWSILLSAVAAIAIEAARITIDRGVERSARRRLDRATRELKALSEEQPAPTPANAAAIALDLAAAECALADGKAMLGPSRARPEPGPDRRPDAYFELAAFVERMRERAGRAHVALRADERFGFSNFAHEGPERTKIAEVMTERAAIEAVLQALWEARPLSLLGLQREGAVKGRRALFAANGGAAAEAFERDPRLTLADGAVASRAFRILFTGNTATLRTLLNTLAKPDSPAWVRGVEVAPAEINGSGAMAESALARPGPSRFTVTVETVDDRSLSARAN